MGNLIPGISKGCRTLHSQPNSSGIPSASTDVSVQPLSVEWLSSWVVSASGTTGVVVTTEVDVTGTSFSFLTQTSDDIPIGPSVVLLLSLSFTVAKNC